MLSTGKAKWSSKAFALWCAVVMVLGLFAGIHYYNSERELGGRDVQAFLNIPSFTPDRFVDPSLDVRSCNCPLVSGVCPCTSNGLSNTSDLDYYSQLEPLKPPQTRIPLASSNVLIEATGYDHISGEEANDLPVSYVNRSRSLKDGVLEEHMLEYATPNQKVRALFMLHDNDEAPETDRSLFLFTLGSWTTPEHILGLREEDYHRRVGAYYYRKGMDVVAFDHGSNGTIETFLNVAALTQGTQILGLWAHSICDFLAIHDLRNNYDRIYLYGLSRGALVVEYTAALCPGFSLAIVGDGISYGETSDFFWNARETSGHLKYGAWFGHLYPVVGHITQNDLMAMALSPIVYTRDRDLFAANLASVSDSFDYKYGLGPNGKWRFVYKSDIGHKPEIELIDKMIANHWSEVEGITLAIHSAE